MFAQLPAPGTRICVIGTSGCGKTTVAQAIAETLDLTYVCNDAIIWRPDWQPAPDGEVYAEMEKATRGERWVFDGNLGSAKPDQLVFSRADTVVWLDLPRWQVWTQVTLRTLSRVLRRTSLWHDNIETWRTTFSRNSVIWWSVKTFSRRRRVYGALMTDGRGQKRAIIHLRSRREVDAWLRSLESAARIASRNRGR